MNTNQIHDSVGNTVFQSSFRLLFGIFKTTNYYSFNDNNTKKLN